MIIIPARVASSRFPSKVLADIFGVPMVVATALRVKDIDDVAIATDSSEVMEIAKSHGIEAVLTRDDHQSGTDRIDEAASILGLGDDDIVLNVQADEPFIEQDVVKALYRKTVEESEAFMTSCYKKIGLEGAHDPNHVKVVVDGEGYALYFSRSIIPYPRGECSEFLGHLGLYGFRRKYLREFCELESSDLENIEKLEQLRALSNGKKIAMIEVESESFGIDTQEDLEKALRKHII